MKTWSVTLPIGGHAYLVVEAETEEEAIEKAETVVTLTDIEEWETLSRVNSGNVCHFPSPWEIEVECIYGDDT